MRKIRVRLVAYGRLGKRVFLEPTPNVWTVYRSDWIVCQHAVLCDQCGDRCFLTSCGRGRRVQQSAIGSCRKKDRNDAQGGQQPGEEVGDQRLRNRVPCDKPIV